MDFITSFGITIYGGRQTWALELVGIEHSIVQAAPDLATVGDCCSIGLQKLSEEQEQLLNALLENLIPTMPNDMPKPVRVTEHVIKAPMEAAIRQQMYRRSP